MFGENSRDRLGGIIQLRTKDIDVVDDRTGNGDDVDREGIEDGRGRDGHGEESRPSVDVRLTASRVASAEPWQY